MVVPKLNEYFPREGFEHPRGVSFCSILVSDSKSCLSGLNWPRSLKKCTFLVGGGDIRYWLEINSFFGS